MTTVEILIFKDIKFWGLSNLALNRRFRKFAYIGVHVATFSCSNYKMCIILYWQFLPCIHWFKPRVWTSVWTDLSSSIAAYCSSFVVGNSYFDFLSGKCSKLNKIEYLFLWIDTNPQNLCNSLSSKICSRTVAIFITMTKSLIMSIMTLCSHLKTG